MRIRGAIILTGIVSSILGALVAYLVLTVPNDLRADAMLKQARHDISEGRSENARASLLTIVQQHPRTDAAAAAIAALVSLAQKDRDGLARAIAHVRTQNEQQSKLIGDLQKSVTELKTAPPKVVTVQAPALKPVVKKAAPAKKPTPKKSTRHR